MSTKNHSQAIETLHQHCIDVANREIYIHGNHYDKEDGIDHTLAATLSKNLRYLDNINSSPILIHLHCSVGGDWSSGVSIYESILNSASRITMLVYSGAASMSALVLQAADIRIMTKSSYLMVHEGDASVSGQPRTIESTTESLKKEREWMYDILAKKCIDGKYFKDNNMPYIKVKKHIENIVKDKQDWYLTPSEAIQYNLCDGILGEKNYESIDKLKCT